MPDAPWLGAWVELPAATFRMGADEADRFATAVERPAREIRLRPFALGVFPVTEVGWEFAGDDGLPKVNVSWDDASAWLREASSRTGLPLRLASEAEWEHAARAGDKGGLPSTREFGPRSANYLYDEGKRRVGPGGRTPRGSYPANRFGLEDMLGNVAEWVGDVWWPNLDRVPEDGRAHVGEGPWRTVRSAGWDAMPRLLRFSARHPLERTRRQDNLGFRIAFDLTGDS